MTPLDGWSHDTSPFHPGELAVQERLGVREKMDVFGRKVVRTFLPDQHRSFYSELPMIYVGHVDAKGRPWASVLTGDAGFISSPDETKLDFTARPFSGDPLGHGLQAGAPLGFVGVNPANRRRNRVNGVVTNATTNGFSIVVQQTFGNCPQYIQTRDVEWTRPASAPNDATLVQRLESLDDAGRALIISSDTFFVATSSSNAGGAKDVDGVDVSHRGGKPGFVKVDGDTLTIPDFPGNLHYNTLGNIEANPQAGLLFMDHATGEILMLTGSAHVIWDGPDVESYRGAERLWQFKVAELVRLPQALPMRLPLNEYSPNLSLTAEWEEADSLRVLNEQREAWREYKVTDVKDESSVIRSFTLRPTDGAALFAHEAGQYLTIRVTPEGSDAPIVRTYTLSSASDDDHYRVSIKREAARGDAPAGAVSNHMHSGIKVGDIIEAKAPRGDFFMDTSEKRPAVLLAGGVGITPMISMARQAASDGLRIRHTRPMTVFHAAQTLSERAFADEFRALSKTTEGKIRYVSVISAPEADSEDYDAKGYITADLLQDHLRLDDYDFYLCGPPPFMQAMYDTLRGLGARDDRIFAEAFGPATLKRTPDAGTATAPELEPEAETAVVEFTKSGVEQPWSKGDVPILELAEGHGMRPEYGCRNGSCGMCAVKVTEGSVTYRTPTSAAHADDEALICCAVPASASLKLDV